MVPAADTRRPHTRVTIILDRQEGSDMTTETLERPAAADTVDLDLDVRIVTAGPVAAALLSSTDDGCDTVRGSDC
jgi:FxLD family lantipeptide